MTVRAIPEHECHVLRGRSARYALVIPVINEGGRFRQQAKLIASLGLPIDVVIADGGSTDGSTEVNFLRSVGIRALLVKTGPGKLSAQLRMAYSWILDQGYEGVVTIDGNGKDGVESVAQFIAALDQGFDYVQGSRYLPGGRAINTPLDRQVGGRLIHAPILSLAAGHWYTDTTNGFRAYSSRYLQDPRVQPFRAIFDRYALLFYLTIRASQLGFRTTEIPVDRHYPPSGIMPTKIAGLADKLKLLGELISVACGRFHPDA